MSALFPMAELGPRVDTVRDALDGRVLLGLHAGAQCGKDMVAQQLAHWNFERVAFACPLKIAVQAIFGLTDRQAFNDRLKNTVIAHLGMTPRELMQRFGTEIARTHIAEDIWLHRMLLSIERVLESPRYRGVCVTDVRFANERDLIDRLGGSIVHIDRQTSFERVDESLADRRATDRSHASETALPRYVQDHVIDNNGNYAHARRQVDALVRSMSTDTARAL